MAERAAREDLPAGVGRAGGPAGCGRVQKAFNWNRVTARQPSNARDVRNPLPASKGRFLYRLIKKRAVVGGTGVHLCLQTASQERGREGPSWEREWEGDGVKGLQCRAVAKEDGLGPVSNPRHRGCCARQPWPGTHRGGAGERLWSGCAMESLCLPGPKGDTLARKHLHGRFTGKV